MPAASLAIAAIGEGKMNLRHSAFALTLAMLSSCGGHQVPLTGLDHISGWADQIRAAADEAYIYTQMSANSYDDGDLYLLGPHVKTIVNVPNDRCGFAYSLFDRNEPGRHRELVIAFRGTEFTTAPDWICGNVLARQNGRGLALYDRVRAATDPSIRISVTGHSLGGGIATFVSLEREGVDSYVFNSSPRFRHRGPAPANRRLSIVEYGEVLKAARLFGREPTQTYISINCARGFHPVRGHFIHPLANCLTRIAAYASPQARLSLACNHIPPPVGVPPETCPDRGWANEEEPR
jgi:hypothetical protein